MAKQKLTDAMVEAVKMGELRKAVKSLNGAKVLKEKLKVANLGKKELAMAFTEAIETLAKNKKLAEKIPADCVTFYNTIWSTPDPPKPKKSDPPKDSGKKGKRKSFSNFEELKDHLKLASNATQFFDKLCLRGAKIETLIKQLDKEYPDFKLLKTKGSVTSHIAYREARGFVYEKDDDKIKLVGFTPKS